MPTGTDLLNKITSVRRQQAALTRFLQNRDEILAAKLFGCGTWLHGGRWPECNDESRLLNANFCKKHLVCMACAARRSVRLVEAYTEKVGIVLEERPELNAAMVTLTLRNGPDLFHEVARLKKAWSAMLAAKRKAASNSDKNTPVEWNKVAGSIRAMEVTKNRKTKEWHAHLHCFVLMEGFIDQKALKAEWLRFTGDSFVVGVTLCRNKETGEPDAMAGLFEVIKYAVKFADMSHEDLWHVFQVLGGTRSVDPQGCLRGVPEPDIDHDSLSGLTGLRIDWIARWHFIQQKYEIDELVPEAVNKFGFTPGRLSTRPLQQFTPHPPPVRSMPSFLNKFRAK